MTTPEARPAAPIVWHDDRTPMHNPCLPFARSTRDLGIQARRIPGQLWQREAARDVQAHGEPKPRRWQRTPRRLVDVMSGARGDRAAVDAYLRGEVERRRPAMRATRAELDALDGRGPDWITARRMTFVTSTPPLEPYRCEVCEEHGVDECPAPPTRLEPEPSSMARTGLALGLAFTSDERGER